MSQYVSPNTDTEFIQRTLNIIAQYKRQESHLGTEYYDVTLLLNCLLGLVVLPRESKLDKFPDSEIPETIRPTLISAKDKSAKDIQIKFKEYIIGLRNGIVHFGKANSLSFKNENGQIAFIEITGETNRHKHILHYRFNLSFGNQLESVVREVLKFISSDT